MLIVINSRLYSTLLYTIHINSCNLLVFLIYLFLLWCLEFSLFQLLLSSQCLWVCGESCNLIFDPLLVMHQFHFITSVSDHDNTRNFFFFLNVTLLLFNVKRLSPYFPSHTKNNNNKKCKIPS